MKRICTLLIMIGLTALGANAQTVTGSGTTNTIPKFTGPSVIGDSVIAESNGNIAVGAGAISPFFDGKLTVVDTRDVNASGVGPSSIFGVAQCTLNNFCSAVRGDAHSGFNIGVLGVNFANDGETGGGGVRGQTFGTSGFTYGVQGSAEGTTGNGTGVFGRTASPSGAGVVGNMESTTGGGGGGVTGATNSADFGFSFATRGTATASTGSALGIFGEVFSHDGAAGYFINRNGGNILRAAIGAVGHDVSVFRVDGNGTVFANGGFRPFGADFAESVSVRGSTENYRPGDLLVIDPSGERRLSLSQTPYSTLVAGIYSTQPGVVASTHRVDEALPKNEIPLAVVGIVPCKVTSENGPIAAGDLLVTSSIAGHAMKGTDRGRMLGAVVGKALEPLRAGAGVIHVLVTLQ